MDAILKAATKAFNPKKPKDTKAIEEFDRLIEKTPTLTVLNALNGLMKSSTTPPWVRSKVKEALSLVPLRPDGVRATLECVASVHPASTVKASEAAVPQKKGANITQEALKIASGVISVPPVTTTPKRWYSAIGPQLLALLDGDEGLDLARAAAYIIGFRILGDKELGATGTVGWRCLAAPMVNPISPPPALLEAGAAADGIVDTTKDRVLVRPGDLVTALHRLQSLLSLHPNPDLSSWLLRPMTRSLWALASWPAPAPLAAEKVCTPALELLKIFLRLMRSPQGILFFVHYLGYVGGRDKSNPEWIFKSTGEGLIQIVDARQPLGSTSTSVPGLTLEVMDQKIPKLLDLVASTFSDADISTAFLELFKKWLKSAGRLKEVDISAKQEVEQDPLSQLSEVKMLEGMIKWFPEKLATQPKHILDLVSQILAGAGDKPDDDDEFITVALSLLSMVITTPGFQKSRVDPEILTLIESSLDTLSKGPSDMSKTATNLRLLLLHRDEIDPDAPATTAPTDRQIKDRQTWSLAISYITEADAPPPVRAEGLNLISTLITSHSPVLDIPAILVLLSSLMADAEEFIYLRIIKLYTQLCNAHPRSVLRELTDHFVDTRETQALDTRLRFGEAILQVIQRMGETFAGDLAHETGNALVAVAGRRGRRPKTEARQLIEAKAQERRNREAAEAWEGEVPDMSDPATAEEKRKNEELEKILAGWDSKRGSEDVRVRASALSILGAAAEVNVAGLGRQVVIGAVDLCVSVLQLETAAEKGILRRAAVVFVMSFVRALEEAREKGRDLGFGFSKKAQEGVTRILRYVSETDNDGLVVQHARDVVESLENWQVVSLLPAEGARYPEIDGLTRLAGLEIDPERSAAGQDSAGSGSVRPRIEEVE
ncbi:hypothetical protein C8A01DRAFT_15594 [Parachaetomium inaequale]|uniref:Uncharacterized protein n=1 Tax=Parachaetomium inaequale TaxID=2588326 RepID=A0AAN6SSD9_9PEZI|nr:hypothetical protein C8A01DRAFT_15594 [Parachaetomium inaequale]